MLRSILLLRALIPSWRFFDAPGEQLTLSLRIGSEAAPEAWTEVRWGSPRNLGSLFFNPRGNHALAMQSMVEQAVTQEPGVAYAVIADACRAWLRERDANAQGEFQFRVMAHADGVLDERLLSAWMQVQP